ncbi:MAG: hypothetical protein L3J81_02760, partial [Thermoplasmata archaeon]|nr:hypothetical protein [Thermoplasmata archaeon]
ALSFAVSLIALTVSLPAGTAAAIFGGAFTPGTVASLGLTQSALTSVFLGGMRSVFRLAAVLVLAGAVFSALRGREHRAGESTTGHLRTVREPTRPLPTEPLGGSPAAGAPRSGP